MVRANAWKWPIFAIIIGFMMGVYLDYSYSTFESYTDKARALYNDVLFPNSFSSKSKVCNLREYLSVNGDKVPGFHILCVSYDKIAKVVNVHAAVNGIDNTVDFETKPTWTSFGQISERRLNLLGEQSEVSKKYKQPWRMFSTEGLALTSLSQVLEEHTVFAFEGGQFIWPGVRIGHVFNIKNVHEWGDVKVETISLKPLVFQINDFLTDKECDLIKDLSLPHLKQSGVSLMDKDKGKAATEWRTSSTYFLSSSKHADLKKIDQRVEDITKVSKQHQEQAQVLRYEHTQKYDAHHDFFNPKMYQQSPDTLQSIHHGYKNRMITVFWYMSDVAKGGHTIFPRAGGLPVPPSFKDCTKGLKVAPKKGMTIVFYSLLPNGQPDEFSLHGGCPVEEGVKFAVNKWIWNKPRS